MKHLLPAFPALEPSGARKMGAQVHCLKIKTWPHIFVGVRQNRRKGRKVKMDTEKEKTKVKRSRKKWRE